MVLSFASRWLATSGRWHHLCDTSKKQQAFWAKIAQNACCSNHDSQDLRTALIERKDLWQSSNPTNQDSDKKSPSPWEACPDVSGRGWGEAP